MTLQWYHYAGGAALAYWLWQKHEEQIAALMAMNVAANAATSDAERSAAEDIAAATRGAIAARGEIAKRDAALAAQAEITAETVGAVSGTVRAVLPPQTNAPPRVVAAPSTATESEQLLAYGADNLASDLRIVPREGSLSIVRDSTYGATPTESTEQRAMAIPTKKSALVVPEVYDAARDTR